MKKVIWITSFFPPLTNVASARNTKLLKYLPEHGWEALVICPEYQTPPSTAGRALLEQLGAAVHISPSGADHFINLVSQRSRKRLSRYVSYFMNNALPPDGHLFWALSSRKHLARKIRAFEPDLVYTTCNPYSLNLLGVWARNRFKLPWITDFRDLWTLNQQPRRAFGAYYKVVSGILEKYYMQRCDYLIASTDNSRNRMVASYPNLAGKIGVVPNGFDPEDVRTDQTGDILPNSFLYSGSIVANTTYHPFGVLQLLAGMEKNGRLPDNWQLHYAGGQGRAFKAYARRAGVNKECVDHGYLDHKHYYRLIRRMDYILLNLPAGLDCTSWVPSRFYDYIGNKARIICLAARGSEIFTLLKKYGNGLALYYEDPETINSKKLHDFIKLPQPAATIADDFLNKYSRARQAHKLSQIFMSLINNAGQGRR